MTALFDTAGIDLKAHKAVKVKTKGSQIRNENKSIYTDVSLFHTKILISWSVCEDISVSLSTFMCAESGLFGVPLPTLLDLDQKRAPGTKVPIILQRVSTAASHIVTLRRGQYQSPSADEGGSCNNNWSKISHVLNYSFMYFAVWFAHCATMRLTVATTMCDFVIVTLSAFWVIPNLNLCLWSS